MVSVILDKLHIDIYQISFYVVIAGATIIVPCVASRMLSGYVLFATRRFRKFLSLLYCLARIYFIEPLQGSLNIVHFLFLRASPGSYRHSAPTGLATFSFLISYFLFFISFLSVNVRYHQIQSSHRRDQVTDLSTSYHMIQNREVGKPG